jgi:hypothetical protein
MKSHTARLVLWFINSIAWPTAIFAFPPESNEDAVRKRFTQWTSNAQTMTAWGQSGLASIEIRRRDGTSQQSEVKTYCGMIRGERLLCDLGIVVFSWEGSERKLYDQERRVLYVIETEETKLKSEPLKAAFERGVEPDVKDELVKIASIALSEVKTPADAAAALANDVASISWQPFLDVNATDQLLKEVANASIRRADGMTTVMISYSYGRTLTLSFDEQTGMVAGIVTEFGDAEMSNAEVGRVVVNWKATKSSSSDDDVKKELSEKSDNLMKKAIGYRRPKAFPASPGEAIVVPDLPRAKGLLGLLDHWIRVLVGKADDT